MSSYATRPTPGDTAWFTRDRFGMFIHWGLYALPARHEWVKTRERMTDADYDRYFRRFDPDLFDPRDWARQAKAAGMRYAVLTAKHHEGFCLFDSQYTDYKATNTPAGRDLVREFTDAFRAEGLRVGLYYSLLDWHHPDFTIDVHHPRRDDPDARAQNEGRSMARYCEYVRNQVRELLTGYGKIDVLWFDFSYPEQCGTGDKAWMKGKGAEDWEAEKLIALARSLQPRILIDNRTGIEQDIWTPEQYQLGDWLRHPETGERLVWEACQTFSGSWGYYRDETSWKSPGQLIRMLVNTVSAGGNLLMNVGPTARGCFDRRACKALTVFADWMKYNSRSIYGCTMAEPDLLAACPRDCRMTQSQDGTRLYLHLFAYPFAHLELRGLAGRVEYAQFLADGSELRFTEGRAEHFSLGAAEGEDLLVIELPVQKPDGEVPVIELFLR
ncbi:MAG: alpha-L-fucosidase [Oscillospiraceae bacterium]|nr:alpha-L-fucosidase [Oscillospiraceae bacterium]MBQ6281234.1 alpha-L-fucosidase [Oscillospiraceae bacterium]MEE3459075.1 alpha-L-fucosidase [Candidatus Faecousia sp.]